MIRNSHLAFRRGLSLIELLVLISIAAILICLMLSAMQKSRELALRAQSQNKLRQIGIGLHNYADNRGHLPGFVHPLLPDSGDDPPLYAILPFLETQPSDQIPLYIDPADPTSNLQFG